MPDEETQAVKLLRARRQRRRNRLLVHGVCVFFSWIGCFIVTVLILAAVLGVTFALAQRIASLLFK